MESEKWNLYHIDSEDIYATEDLKYWTLTYSENGSDQELFGVCTKVYPDGSIDYLGRESQVGKLIES